MVATCLAKPKPKHRPKLATRAAADSVPLRPRRACPIFDRSVRQFAMPLTTERIEDLQAEAMADDVDIRPEMKEWTEAQVLAYFESGGVDEPNAGLAKLEISSRDLVPTDGSMPMVTLNDGRMMPRLGLGTWKSEKGQAFAAVRAAIRAGYRHIDTAYVSRPEPERSPNPQRTPSC